MRTWTSREARHRLGTLMDTVKREGPQRVRGRADSTFILLEEEQFKALLNQVPGLGELISSSPLDLDDISARLPAKVYRDDPFE